MSTHANPNALPRIYVAGPMRDYPDNNRKAFNRAENALRAAGWYVSNPAHHLDSWADLPIKEIGRRDLEDLFRCDAIALLPNWRRSKGARAEYAVAKWYDMPDIEIIDTDWWKAPTPDAVFKRFQKSKPTDELPQHLRSFESWCQHHGLELAPIDASEKVVTALNYARMMLNLIPPYIEELARARQNNRTS